MRLLLIQSSHLTRDGKVFKSKGLLYPGLALPIIASLTPGDVDMQIVNDYFMDIDYDDPADLVAITAMTPQAPRAYQLADGYRRLGVPVVMGGIHPSALPDEALKRCDSVCKGDAESTLPHLIADVDAARARGLDPRSSLRPVYDWATFPTAPIATPRKDLIDPADYLVANPIQTTRGCPHACNFCTTPAVFGRKFRQRSVTDIVEEMRAVCDVQKPWCFIFADDNFGGNQAWALELCEALTPLKVSWATQCDILISKNDRLLRAMRASGCVGLILGLESPKPETLAEAGKKFVRPDTYAWRIRKIRGFGINLWGAFIFGFDHDTWQDCMHACRFAQRMNLAMSCFPILTPYPGTEFFCQFQREGRIRTYDWEKYNGASVVYEPRQMTAKQLRHAQMAAFAEFYTPRSALRRLRVFPVQSRSWVANLAIWKGIRYYYGRKHRQAPQFRDFLDPDARAWNYTNEPWTSGQWRGLAKRGLGESDEAPAAETERLGARLRAASDPLVQAALAMSANGT